MLSLHVYISQIIQSNLKSNHILLHIRRRWHVSWNLFCYARRSYSNLGADSIKKIPYYQYRKSHCGDKTILRSSYLHHGVSYTGKTASLYWIGTQFANFGEALLPPPPQVCPDSSHSPCTRLPSFPAHITQHDNRQQSRIHFRVKMWPLLPFPFVNNEFAFKVVKTVTLQWIL